MSTEIVHAPNNELAGPSIIDVAEVIIRSCLDELVPDTFHFFVPGIYIRKMCVPAGTVVTSKIHKTRHPFIMTKGRAILMSEGSDPFEVSAPFCGITEPGTRRMARVLEDMEWITFHVTDKTDLAEIEDEIIMPHVNPLLETPETLSLP